MMLPWLRALRVISDQVSSQDAAFAVDVIISTYPSERSYLGVLILFGKYKTIRNPQQQFRTISMHFLPVFSLLFQKQRPPILFRLDFRIMFQKKSKIFLLEICIQFALEVEKSVANIIRRSRSQ